jgi:hypothetical protein
VDQHHTGVLGVNQLLEIVPKGVLHFPGTGINDNLADKAKKLGIPVCRQGCR